MCDMVEQGCHYDSSSSPSDKTEGRAMLIVGGILEFGGSEHSEH